MARIRIVDNVGGGWAGSAMLVGMGDIEALLARQGGVVGRAQLLARGFTVDQVRARLERGEWVREYPAVYRVATHPLSAEVRVRTAALWAGGGRVGPAALIGWAAAWWWELTDRFPPVIEIAIGRRAHRRPVPGIRLRRIALPSRDLNYYRELRIADRPHAALFGAVAMGSYGPAMLDRALQRSVTLDSITQSYHRNRCRTGAVQARKLLTAASDGAAAESERLLCGLLRKGGVRGWQLHRRVIPHRSWEVDLVFEEAKVAVEVDGWAWHHTPDRFLNDRRKQNALIGAGWLILRYTWFDLTERPEQILAEIKAAVALRIRAIPGA